MKYQNPSKSIFKTVLTVVLCLSFAFGLTQQNHATLQLGSTNFNVAGAVTDDHHPSEAETDATNLSATIANCIDHALMDQSHCADECCESFCQTFAIVPAYTPVKLLPGITTDQMTAVFTNRAIEPLPFPPRSIRKS